MKTPPKVLWTEGVTLRPQHLQQSDRYHESRLHQIASAMHPHSWGVRSVAWNQAALENNLLRADAMSLIFQDGEPYDAPASDLLPEAVDLAGLPSTEETFTFYAALPAFKCHGGNLAGFSESPQTHARFLQVALQTPDLYTGALDADVVYLAKKPQLLSHLVPRSEFVSMPVVRLRRLPSGGFETDPTFVAPSISIAAAPAITRQLDALMQKLQAKIDVLYGVQREPTKDAVVQGGDVSSFWLLHTISTGCASLHHYVKCQEHHPERLYHDLLGLAGGLMTFSRRFRIGDLPGYSHEQPGPAFAKLVAIVRDLVDTVISSKYLAIPLVQDAARPSYFEAKLPSDAIDQHTVLCLGVRAEMPALELVTAVPTRFKVGTPDDVSRMVASALPGVQLVHMPQVPAAVPVRPNTQYFTLQSKSQLYANMLQAQALSVYVPSGVRELQLELFALTS
jgi:type VI secretion system protein ImpJ